MVFILLTFLATILALITQFSHFLMSLFCLESMMLCLVLLIPLMTATTSINMPQISMILLTFGACEASLGLSLMVLMSRAYGSDMLNSITMNKC